MKEIIDRHTRSNGQGQGMNWIRKEKRLAIYLRDGMACCYCGEGIEETKLTLDHLTAHSRGGTNDPQNLVTCCHKCNSARGSRSWRAFAKKVADYVADGATAKHIIAQITATTKRGVDVNAAKRLMARRGGFTAALHA
jgi:5-methylcytosine-specific restriction endonuclease McrA